jgi:hypothetical protein
MPRRRMFALPGRKGRKSRPPCRGRTKCLQSALLSNGVSTDVVGARGLAKRLTDGGVELSDENEANEDESEPRAVNAAPSTERQLVDRVTLHPPRLAETDVAHANRSPGEERGQSGESLFAKKGLVSLALREVANRYGHSPGAS